MQSQSSKPEDGQRIASLVLVHPFSAESTGIKEGPAGSDSKNDSTVPSAGNFTAKAQNVTLTFTPATPITPSGSTAPLSDSNSTGTDTPAIPLTSNTSGRFHGSETGWTGSPNGSETDPSDSPATSTFA